jgi:tRNA A37 methylthiotransferase MiaB
MSLKTPEYQLNYFTDPYDKQTDIVFLNTCGFISSGRDEADETVKKLLKAKKTVYLLGCAVQYYKKLQAKSLKLKAVSGVHYLSRGDLNKVNLKNIMQ